ncbi:helix-turn-helix domain-containing protein [Sutcliffiella horikoshii]|uniref:helix-turn-helix domain-containing protein n=1 Tax=Sutcliffiella horikoshii TaxID=79883 RepID=UPI001CBCC673|nr:helix-turn-helix transcriptional regulator [Sutcliffiella horikoshii]MCM3619709.1 helix-turn-helix domain-containing protein [Sutcliffiella horikoshii]UAL49766.1 helix-turn-helix domain-containing protein [Sutcliffiella horikoshii]
MNPMKLEQITIETDVERLILLRKKLEKKQYEFARELGISTNYLVAVENYRLPFSNKLKRKVDRYLNNLEMEKVMHDSSACLFK